MRDQTVGSNSREGGAWPGKQGKLGIAIDWVTGRSGRMAVRPTLAAALGSMYSQAHVIERCAPLALSRAWLLVIRMAEKACLGSKEGLVFWLSMFHADN